MKTLILLIFSIFLLNCSKPNQIKETKSISNNLAEPSPLICKRQIISGSRRHVKVCLTKEQREIERLESQNAIKNATDARAKVQPGK